MAFSTTSKFILFAFVLGLNGCSSMLYFPTRIEYVDRKKMPVKPIDIIFPSEDGKLLHAWQFHAVAGSPSKCVILQFHGNGQNLSTHFLSLYWILEDGVDYMTFDYHGYGSRTGEPSPKATVEDGHAALRKIHELYPDKKIVVVAQSLGGAIGLRSVIDMKNEIPVALVLADSTFASYRSAARSLLSRHWQTWLLQPLGWLAMSDKYAPGDEPNSHPHRSWSCMATKTKPLIFHLAEASLPGPESRKNSGRFLVVSTSMASSALTFRNAFSVSSIRSANRTRGFHFPNLNGVRLFPHFSMGLLVADLRLWRNHLVSEG